MQKPKYRISKKVISKTDLTSIGEVTYNGNETTGYITQIKNNYPFLFLPPWMLSDNNNYSPSLINYIEHLLPSLINGFIDASILFETEQKFQTNQIILDIMPPKPYLEILILENLND